MSKFNVGPISVDRLSNSQFPRLDDVAHNPSCGQLKIVVGAVRFPNNQCPGCQHVCRDMNGRIWKIAVEDPIIQSNIYNVNGSEKGFKQTKIKHDVRYSTFCTLGTNIDPISKDFDIEVNGNVQIIPSEGIPYSEKPFSCPFGGFKKI